MEYSVRKLKKWEGREGQGYTGELLRDGNPVGTFRNDGNGGQTFFDFFISDSKGKWLKRNPEEEQRYMAFAESQPKGRWPAEFGGEEYEMTGELYLLDLLDQYEEKLWLKRKCAKKTLFRLKGDGRGWRTLDLPFTAQVKQAIIDKFGDRLERIANETV